ncbi:MAG: murein biosynthesis integral membrane protein MurJ [Alphaproteobacteria bacterium]
MRLIGAMATVGGLTGLSRIAGFARDIMTAAILGTGPVADAFFVALKLPNFFRRVTAEGAFSVSFVPVYSESLEKEGREEADHFALNVFYIMLGGLGVISLLAVWAMPFVIYAVAPGFSGDEIRYDLAVEFSRVTFPYLLLMSLTALLGGVLNAQGKFAPFAFAPVLFNLALITALLLSDLTETAGHALSWGVLIAGFLQCGWLLINVIRAGFVFKFKTVRFDVKTKKVLKLMGPGVIGAGVMHINLFADLILASFLATGSVSYLYYADRLNQLPLGVVGIAVGTALLPMLSRALGRGDMKEGRNLLNRALEYCLLLALPAAAALVAVPYELITVLFERGAFTAADTKVTAFVLTCYAIGLPAHISVKVFSTAHWARQDTVTPVKISVAATVTNIVLSLLLIQYIGVAGIALGTGLTGWMQFFLHIRALRDHPAVHFDARFKRNALRIVLSTCFMTVVLVMLASGLKIGAHDEQATYQIPALATLILAGVVSYALAVIASGVIKIQDLKRYLSRG